MRLVRRRGQASRVDWGKTSQIGGLRVGCRRLVFEDENDEDSGLVIRVRLVG